MAKYRNRCFVYVPLRPPPSAATARARRIGNERPTHRLHRSEATRHLHRPAGQKGIIPTRIQDEEIEGSASRGHAGKYLPAESACAVVAFSTLAPRGIR